MTSINAVASSSKRSAPSQPTNTAKRSRLNRVESGEDDMSEEEQEVHENMDEATRAKIARKEARTIRNRESAQRSRNQRKAHLVYLEQRVSELEAENRALRAGETPPPRASPPSAERESSPAQSVISLANDLGIPPEIVSSSGGVSLANVAPPPADLDLDVKPVIHPPSPVIVTQSLTFGDNTASSLESENASLRERIALLESLVKQVVALANLSGLPSSASPAPAPASAPPAIENTLDWDTLVNSTSQGNLDATLSPPMYPVQPLESNTTQFNLTPSLPSVPAFPSNPEMNLACHPAAGEETFIFGNFGNEFGAFGNDGKGDCAIGSSTGNVVPFSFEKGVNSTGSIETFEGAENTEEAAEWDEGMRALLEDLEGRSGDVVSTKNEVVRGDLKREFSEEWWFGRSNEVNTVLGLAM